MTFCDRTIVITDLHRSMKLQ